ncbi:MAG: hypothetical protein KDE27_17485, partial [Planctomycetes bacterium]|nr:hypothetical protein [Planctomycetota bacterium]
MRKLPLLMIALVLVVAVSFGIAVMLDQPAVTTPASPVTAPSGLPQGHVYAGVTEEPDDVNPFTSHSEVARRFVLGLTHEGLVDTDPASGELRGAAADSWRLAADGMSATFHLRDGLVFSDGTAVTMADVLFGWQLAHADHLPLGFVGDAFGRVADARAADERTLELTFRERYYATVRAVGEYWLVAQRQFFVDRVAALAKRLGVEVPPVESVEFA